MGVSRHREETISDVQTLWNMDGNLSNPVGSCTASPGPLTYTYFDNSSGSEDTLYEFRSIDDVVTPDFKKLMGQGKIINNPVNMYHERTAIPTCDVLINYMIQCYGCSPARWFDWREVKVEGTKGMSALLGGSIFSQNPEVDVESLKDQATSKAWARISHSDMLALATIAECNEAIAGLIYIFHKVYKIIRAVKRMEVKALMKELKPSELEEVYMNARYNLRPLYYDAKALVDIFNHVDKGQHRQTFRASKKSKESTDSSNVVSLFAHGNYVTVDINVDYYADREVNVRAGVLTSVGNVTNAQIFGFDRLVETAWDLLPFSFIIDWFFNVGTVLSSWSPNAGFKVLASWVTVEDITTYSTAVTGLESNIMDTATYHFVNEDFHVDNAVASKYTRSFNRFVDYSRPTLPTFSLNLDPLKILDLGIILKKMFFKRNKF